MMENDVVNQTDMFEALFNALPAWVFVVDREVRIRRFNKAAGELFSANEGAILEQRAGDVFHCINAIRSPDGCGQSETCQQCIIRNSVCQAFQGKRIVRRRVKMRITHAGQKMPIYALITVNPFRFNGESLSLLVIEDISEIAELQRMIPICSICKKVRDDTESWQLIESYLKQQWDVDFSHSYCPSCYEKELAKLRH